MEHLIKSPTALSMALEILLQMTEEERTELTKNGAGRFLAPLRVTLKWVVEQASTWSNGTIPVLPSAESIAEEMEKLSKEPPAS